MDFYLLIIEQEITRKINNRIVYTRYIFNINMYIANKNYKGKPKEGQIHIRKYTGQIFLFYLVTLVISLVPI